MALPAHAFRIGLQVDVSRTRLGTRHCVCENYNSDGDDCDDNGGGIYNTFFSFRGIVISIFCTTMLQKGRMHPIQKRMGNSDLLSQMVVNKLKWVCCKPIGLRTLQAQIRTC
jgi:hypothetical protein